MARPAQRARFWGIRFGTPRQRPWRYQLENSGSRRNVWRMASGNIMSRDTRPPRVSVRAWRAFLRGWKAASLLFLTHSRICTRRITEGGVALLLGTGREHWSGCHLGYKAKQDE